VWTASGARGSAHKESSKTRKEKDYLVKKRGEEAFGIKKMKKQTRNSKV